MTSNNGYINNPESAGELIRLIRQAELLDGCIGVVPRMLHERPFGSILDIGCGPGDWAMHVALVCPDADVIGMDRSQKMVEYAMARAVTQHMDTVGFEVRDALSEQEFPLEDEDYDFIRLSLASSWIPDQATWQTLLQQCWKMLVPGGVVVIVEFELALTNSEALNRFQTILLNAFKQSGRSVSVGENFGVVTHLGRALRQAGFQTVGIEVNAFDFSSYNEQENLSWRDLVPITIYEVKPFLLAQQVTTEEELADLEGKIRTDMYQEHFCGIAPIYTSIGIKEERDDA